MRQVHRLSNQEDVPANCSFEIFKKTNSSKQCQFQTTSVHHGNKLCTAGTGLAHSHSPIRQ